MSKKLVLAAAMAALLAVGCGKAQEEPQGGTSTGTVERRPDSPTGKQAVAQIAPRSGSQVSGTATFTETADGKVMLVVEIENAEPGVHGIHLHEKGDCSASDAKSAGDHWNPTSEAHGKIGETEKSHSGDMGNIEVGPDGKGRMEFTTDRWSIGGDERTNVIGRSIVVHAKADDLQTQPSGDSGDRIGCGEIR